MWRTGIVCPFRVLMNVVTSGNADHVRISSTTSGWILSDKKVEKSRPHIRASSADDHALEAMEGDCVASPWGSVARIGLANAPRCADLCRPRRIAGAGNHRGGCSLGRAMRVRSASDTFAIVLRRIRREECKLGDEVIAHAPPPFAAGLLVALRIMRGKKVCWSLISRFIRGGMWDVTSQLVPDLGFAKFVNRHSYCQFDLPISADVSLWTPIPGRTRGLEMVICIPSGGRGGVRGGSERILRL